MEAEDIAGVLSTLQNQYTELRSRVTQDEANRVQAFEQDKPQLRQLISALEDSRQTMEAELKNLQANPQQAKAKQVAKKGVQAISSGFNAIRTRPKADGKPMSDEELRSERQHLQDSLEVLTNKILSVREDISKNMRAEEREIWETNLVILQDTRRMHQEELDLIEVELMGRQRLAQAAADQAEAEASGAAAISRLTDQLMLLDTRIDRLKQQLYFPAVQGYNLTFGGSGVYIGMKDYLISEVAGGFSLTLDSASSTRKSGAKAGRITMQVGAQPAPPPSGRTTAPAGPEAFTKPVQNSFKLRTNPGGSGAHAPVHSFGQGTRTVSGGVAGAQTPDAQPEPRTSDGASTSASGRLANIASGPRATKGKKMAMKFLNKMGTKDKFSKHIPGLGRTSEDEPSIPEEEEAAPQKSGFASRLIKKRSGSVPGPPGAHLSHSISNGRDPLDDDEPDEELEAAAAAANENLPDVLDSAFATGLPGSGRNAVEDFDAASTTGGSTEGDSAPDAASSSSQRKGLFAVVRCNDVALLGEKGSKVPNASIGQLSLEIEIAMTLSLEYNSVGGWSTGARPHWELTHLRRAVTGNSVPMPRALLRLVLALVVPRLITRLLLTMLPPELGTYLLAAEQTVYLAGEVQMVGPPLSAMDAEVAFQMANAQPSMKVRDAQKSARQHAASQEARSMLGLDSEQAAVLADVLGGQHSILPPRQIDRGTSLGDILYFCRANASAGPHWEQIASLVDTAARMVAKYRGVAPPPAMQLLVRERIGPMLLKPVRARLVATRVEFAFSIDAALASTRAYLERSAREMAAKVPGSTAAAGLQEGDMPLEVQLQVLAAWHTWLLGALRHFKSKFRGSSATLLAVADCRSFATGIENCRFEGPVRLCIPCPPSLGAVDADGGFSFELPLPNPEQNAVMTTFLDGLRAALTTPLAMMHTPATGPSAEKQEEELQRSKSEAADMMRMSPLDWFGKWQESGGAEAAPNADYPSKLGKFMVNSARVRLKLDEARIAELLQEGSQSRTGGMSLEAASATARILGCLGDIGIASFAPGLSEEGVPRYEVRLETGEVANLAAELGSAGFKSGEGISPGRLLRVAHALGRACLLTVKGRHDAAERLEELDRHANAAYEHLVREALDGSLTLHTRAFVQGAHLLFCMSGPPQAEAGPATPPADPVWPFIVTNDVDLATLIGNVRREMQD